MINVVCCPWLTLAQTQMDHNFLSLVFLPLTWMGNMLSLVKCSKEWMLSENLKTHQLMIVNQERSVILFSFFLFLLHELQINSGNINFWPKYFCPIVLSKGLVVEWNVCSLSLSIELAQFNCNFAYKVIVSYLDVNGLVALCHWRLWRIATRWRWWHIWSWWWNRRRASRMAWRFRTWLPQSKNLLESVALLLVMPKLL